MKLGTLVEHVTRCLCTKFEPFPVASFLRNDHLIVLSRVHATLSVRRLRGFPREAGDETRYVGRTRQEVSGYQI